MVRFCSRDPAEDDAEDDAEEEDDDDDKFSIFSATSALAAISASCCCAILRCSLRSSVSTPRPIEVKKLIEKRVFRGLSFGNSPEK